MHNPLSDSLEDLVRALEPLRHDPGAADSPRESAFEASDSSEQTWRSIDALARRYEVVVWEVVMPHLIRNAPQLAPEVVATLQKNHQLEKELLDEGFQGPPNGETRRAHTIASITRLVTVLRETLGIIESDVTAAFEALPEEQRSALLAVVEHELARVDGDADEPDESVLQAIDTLETERSSLPIPAATMNR